MNLISKFFALIISIIILLLPLFIFIFHYLYACDYILFVTSKNNNDICNILKDEYYNLDTIKDIKKIELYNKRLSRYYILKVYYENDKVEETSINRENKENSEYEIVDYLEDNAINADKIITFLNIISLIIIVVIIPTNRKKGNRK